MNSANAKLFLITGLSLSIGWGIHGNFGHEYGAMIPGALAAMAAVILSGREDWISRIGYFAFFGALGWSFGGSISYMQVIGYTHSGVSSSVLYGFACLFVIGFLWAAMGGAGTALPIFLNKQSLANYFPAILTVFVAWEIQDFVVGHWIKLNPDFRQESPLYWYDTDWLSVLAAMVAVILFAASRRRWCEGASLVIHMCVGWWIGFLGLVIGLGWRMTPPRGDNWAGCLGMTGGLLMFLFRRGLSGVAWASILSGLVGGLAFAGATLFKLVAMITGWSTNWHSVLEQTYGFLNGLGIAAAIALLANNAPKITEASRPANWTQTFSFAFVLIAVTYLNLVKNVGTWIKAKTVPETMAGLSATTWFTLAYAAIGVLVISILRSHQRRPLPLFPMSSLGRGQLFYLVFLWWIVIGNFERAVVSFSAQRLITEGVIFFNAALCTWMIVQWPPPMQRAKISATAIPNFSGWLRETILVGTVASVAIIAMDWGIVRAIYGDRFAGHANLHIRFGPNATATKLKPAAGKPHP